jgi:hypothetical protein
MCGFKSLTGDLKPNSAPPPRASACAIGDDACGAGWRRTVAPARRRAPAQYVGRWRHCCVPLAPQKPAVGAPVPPNTPPQTQHPTHPANCGDRSKGHNIYGRPHRTQEIWALLHRVGNKEETAAVDESAAAVPATDTSMDEKEIEPIKKPATKRRRKS